MPPLSPMATRFLENYETKGVEFSDEQKEKLQVYDLMLRKELMEGKSMKEMSKEERQALLQENRQKMMLFLNKKVMTKEQWAVFSGKCLPSIVISLFSYLRS